MLPVGLLPRSGVWEHIASTVLDAAAVSVRFDFSPVYRALWVEAYIKNDANSKEVGVRLNGDGGTNYDWQRITASSTTVTGSRVTANEQFLVTATNNIVANERASFTALVIKPTAGARAQFISHLGHNASPVLALLGGEWTNTTDLVSRLDVLATTNNFAANTAIKVYGSRRVAA